MRPSRAFGLALFLLVALTFSLGRLGPADAEVFNPQSAVLDNGLEVVVVTNRRAPVVTHMLWYKVGSADEPLGKSGIAHYLEHLMFKGTKTLGEGEFSEIIARNGGRENAFTSYDYTGYFQMVASDRLALMMEHEADRMANLVLTDEVTLAERDVILEERNSRVDNEPAARLGEMSRASLFVHHPYGRPIIGWRSEMEQLSTQDALDFYETWYAPNNAVLIVSGDVSFEEVMALAEETYGKVPARAVPKRNRVAEPPHWADKRVSLTSEQVGQPSMSVSYHAPSYNLDPDGHAYALNVLSEILSGNTGLFYDALVRQQKIAVSAGSYYSGDNFDLGTFGIFASPAPGIEIAQLEAAIQALVKQIIEEGVPAEELAKAKQRLLDSAVFARDDPSTAARVIGQALTTGQTVADVEDWPNRIAAVELEDVNAAARAVLAEGTASVTAVLLSASDERS